MYRLKPRQGLLIVYAGNTTPVRQRLLSDTTIVFEVISQIGTDLMILFCDKSDISNSLSDVSRPIVYASRSSFT